MAPFISPHLRTDPQIVSVANVEPGANRTLLLIVAHGDDPAFFSGGVVPLWAGAGWRVVCLRITDDRWDSVGLDEAETIRRNTAEFGAAARVLGIAETHDLLWQTDVLGDVSRVKLRERIIHAIRRFRPYGVVTFDPDSLFFEDNLDHRVLGQAVDEACWCAQFDKHHPEHFEEGLALHGVVQRWFFGRSVVSVTHVIDVSPFVETQLQAILTHRTMLDNIVRQFALQAETAGVTSDLVTSASRGELRPLFEHLLTDRLAKNGEPFGLAAAITMRLHAASIPL